MQELLLVKLIKLKKYIVTKKNKNILDSWNRSVMQIKYMKRPKHKLLKKRIGKEVITT